MRTLNDASLFRQSCYIDGCWMPADSGATIPVTDPATGEQLGTVPRMGAAETARAVAAAEAALPAWRARTAGDRCAVIRRWFELMMDNKEDLAAIMTSEQGKPLAEARGEIDYSASFLEWFAEEGKRTYGDIIPTTNNKNRIMVIKQPIGVVAAITPWNFPSAMITRKAGPALAVGCTLVLKPATATPYSALALAELGERAGIPKGVFSVVTGLAGAIGGELSTNPIVRKLTFTGSTEIGKLLIKECAGTVKKVSMELGGHAPFLVFDDADLDAAVAGAMVSKFRNTGQTCACTNRFLVQDTVYDVFLEKFARAVGKLKVGNGFALGVDQGPMIDANAMVKAEEHVQDALARGGRVVIGGNRHSLGGNFFEPTILADVTMEMVIAHEETFGPVAPLIRFKTEEEAIRLANDTPFGLASYLYTRDLARSWRVAEALDYGMVGLNTGLISNAVAPFGGVKESGLGREGSKYGIDDYTEVKYICVGLG